MRRIDAIEAYLLDQARRHGFPATIVHPGHIVGPGWNPLNPAGHFNPQVFATLAKGDELAIPNFGLESVHHVHADDVAQVFMQAIANWSQSVGEAFHAVSPAALTLRGYAEATAAWFGREAKLKFLPWPEWKAAQESEEEATATWEHIARSPSASLAKAERLLAYRPRYALYDPSRNMFIWFLQYIKDGSDNHFRIALFRSETANISNAGWISYTFAPSAFGGPASGEWFDYPHLTLSNDFLYIAINVFTVSSDSWTRTIFMRLSLDTMKAGGALSAQYLSTNTRFNFTPVQGAKDVMYWASQFNGTTLTVYRGPESSGTITSFNKTVPAWTVGTQHDCPSTDGTDWCERSDNRVGAGVLQWNQLTKQGELIFFWNVAEGSGFTWPYINAAKFRESDLAYLSRPYLFNQGAAFHYLGAAPNGRGDVGLSVAYACTASRFPCSAVCIDDDFNGDPPGWECAGTRSGAHGPISDRWGDYQRVRPAYPTDFTWIGTGYTLQASTATGNAEPRYIVFGRERDQYQYLRFYNR